MNLKQIKNVMIKYGHAWEEQDSKLVLECFTKNAIYQESPLAKPHKGHEEIKRFWDDEVVRHTRNISFKLGKCYVSEDSETGFAEWECRNEYKQKGRWRKDHMVGIMILKMKGDKIYSLNEYWNKREV